MALKIWLPLNGNLNNLGLSSVSIINCGASIDINGKIGSCYSFDGVDDRIVIKNFSIGNEWSYGFWYYSAVSSRGWEGVLLLNSDGGDPDIQMGMYNYPSGGRAQTSVNGVYNSNVSITFGQWNHWFATFDGTTLLTYVNGVLVNTKSVSAAYLPRTNLTIGARCSNTMGGDVGAGNFFLGKINDVRIYDECLSPKQVKEISKGLVAHYKLDTARAINNLKRNVVYGTYNNFASSGSTCTVVDTGTTYMGAKVYRMTYTPNETSLSSVKTSLHSHGVTTSGQTFTAGVKYCYWTLCKPISHLDTIVGGTASNIGYWYEIPMKECGNGWYIVGQKRTGNAPENKSDTIFTSFKTPSATSGTPIIIDFCCPHLIEGYDEILPEFDYQGTAVTQERDVSGNGYNGTITGTLTFNPDSPRYDGSTKFDANTSYIKLPTLTTGGFASSFTIIYWANIADMNGKMAWGFGDGNRLNIYPSSSVFCCNTGDGSNNQYKNNGTAVAFAPYNNAWHQYAMVGDGTTNKLYIDGVYAGTATTYKGITGSQLYISGWDTGTGYKWTGGSICDFRIYATALSADDILTMYKNSGIIDNKGNVYAYEFKEE